jgi:AcrR family transcriptional regulator
MYWGNLMSRLHSKKKAVVGELMRDLLYRSARKVLEDYGWKGTTMDRVAQQAGVAKGTVYNYFKNKRELMAFVLDKNVEPLNQKVASIIDDSPSSMKEALADIIQTVLNGMKQNRKINSAMILAFHEDVELRRSYNPEEHPLQFIRNGVRQIIAEGISSGEFRLVNPLLAEAMIHSLITGLSRQIAFGYLDITEKNMDNDIVSIILDGLAAPIRGGNL